MENLLRRMKSKLAVNFYIMNDLWLRDCVEYFIRDKAPNEMTDRHILDFVEGQWQLCNLRDISNENGCLPENLAQQVRTVLNSTYILQVDRMYDISNSKYKQLCHIRKVNSDNLEITEREKPQEWEPKGRRMMQWCLTDGVQNITAIEYTPMKQVTCTLLPGYKVMIIGPVDCRRGVILLEEGKYREIGGEVESMLRHNALENVLARALDKPENPDPYHDNGLLQNLNNQNITPNHTNEDSFLEDELQLQNQNNQNIPPHRNEDSFFDDDFEEAVDLEELTAIEQQTQRVVETVQNHSTNREQRQDTQMDIAEEFLEDINFEPLETWPNENHPAELSRVLPSTRMKTIDFKEDDDVIIIEESSDSVHASSSKPLVSVRSCKNDISDFPDDDFDFDDCEVVVKKESRATTSKEQSGNFFKLKSKTGVHSLPQATIPKLRDSSVTIKTERRTSTETSMMRNKKSVASTSKAVQEIPKTKKISNFFVPAAPKIYDVLSDVLRENVTETMHRTVKARVKKHSTLKKQGNCWAVTALIADHTSSVEVYFDSEILEKFLGFTVKEFSMKKKIAKSNPQVQNELRLSLRKAQHQIENLNAVLKLELTQGQMPKVVGITQQ